MRKTGGKAAAIAAGAGLFLLMMVLPLQPLLKVRAASKAARKWTDERALPLAAGWAGVSALLALAVGLRVATAKPKDGGPVSRWDDPGEFPRLDGALARAVRGPEKDSGTLLGMANGVGEVRLSDRARESHMQLVGPTRSGKSQLLFSIAAQDMRRGLPVFFMEAKGDRSDFEQFHKLAGLAGRARDVRYFNPHDPMSMTFNPIRPVPGQDSTAIANQIARAIGREPTSAGEGQDYYRSVDYAKIQTMAEVFCKTGRQFTLRDCFYYFSSDKARVKAFSLCGDNRLVSMAAKGFKDSPDSTALTSSLRPWMTGTLGALLNSYSPQIQLEDVFEQGRLAYFAVPIGHLQLLANPLGRMVISGLLSIAASRQKAQPKPEPASVVLDEFAEFATPVFASVIATVGSARLWTILSHQDLGQLERVQGMDVNAFKSSVFNNTSGAKVCFRTPDPQDAEHWAGALGTRAEFEDTERVSKWLFGEIKTGEKSRRSVEHFKIHPNKLKNLAPGTAMIASPGAVDCLARTARVHGVTKGLLLPPVPHVETKLEAGLDLAAEASDLKAIGEHFSESGTVAK